ncbi:hypothetical protein GCM10011396_35060 [Undibacterium terreum]|uniref:Uncharacterized protein n=1 Tax=Undibacterium terreum TaxID=1224302 RepID=A0A916XN57_9BURK|nr:hypothetical protein GCM10011396_35060 [Undibacterium terreum]
MASKPACWSADRADYGRHEATPDRAEVILASGKTDKRPLRASAIEITIADAAVRVCASTDAVFLRRAL